MKQSSGSQRRIPRNATTVLLLALALGCAEAEAGHPAAYEYEATPAPALNSVDRCAVPNEGCACDSPGEVLDCGKVVVKVDDYETCYPASRLCRADRTWGKCVSDQAIVQMID